MTAGPPLLELRRVSKRFVKRLDALTKAVNLLGAGYREQVVHAVDEVSITVGEGEVVGLVGESGCGKSTIGRIAAGLLAPSSGDVLYRGRPRAELAADETRAMQLKTQMVFQDPFSSLNPRKRVREMIGEAPRLHRIVPPESLEDYIDEVMQTCGLDPSYKRRYPHQFSGGQRQRIGIARALAVKPEFLILDEAVASLDVSIQAQILNLFMKLREELALTYLFISHDLGVVEHLSDRVVTMYLGRVVETAPTERIFSAPNHPYTRALLAEVPRLDNRSTVYAGLEGEIPSALAPPPGCHFHPRCPHAMAHCRVEVPRMREIAPGHWSACHLNERGPSTAS